MGFHNDAGNVRFIAISLGKLKLLFRTIFWLLHLVGVIKSLECVFRCDFISLCPHSKAALDQQGSFGFLSLTKLPTTIVKIENRLSFYIFTWS